MDSSRALGGLLCAVSTIVTVLHLYYGYWVGSWGPSAFAFSLPITVFLLIATSLGFWLGWIMLTTKEAGPAPETTKIEEESEESDESDE